ncbi:MAG: hypothetical protein ACREEG_00730 [Phenylobacterium sp.]
MQTGAYQVEHIFKVKVGRSTYEVDAAKEFKATGRADIILNHGGRALAVLELKKPGAALTDEDGRQGLSYARLLDPMPPMVVVAAGKNLRFIDTYTGEVWMPDADVVSEAELGRRFSAAAAVAAADRAKAIETLLGPDSAAWMSLMADASDTSIGAQSGAWSDTLRPFVDGFLIPRTATRQTLDAFDQGDRLVFVTGDPLVGKSNVLRELAETARQDPRRAVLYVEGDGHDEGLYQRIATLLEAQFAWPADRDGVRRWLRQLSAANGQQLVIAVDGLPRDRARLLAEITELTSEPFGPGVRIALALDPEDAHELGRDPTGRKASHLGRVSQVVKVRALSEPEVRGAGQLLYAHRVAMLPGFHACRQYRTPWVLRAIMAVISASPSHQKPNIQAIGPAVLGMRLFPFIRERYRDEPELRAAYQAVARALIKDLKRQRPMEVVLEGLAVFAITRKGLRAKVDPDDIKDLKRLGALREAIVGGERVFVPQLPELMASELAVALGVLLAKKMRTDPKAAADWLIAQTSLLPMGDIIGAQAIVDAAAGVGRDFPLGLVETLMSARPRTETLSPGHIMATRIPGAGLVKLEIVKGGKLIIRGNGREVTVDDDEPHTTYADTESWSILAHLASMQMGVMQDGVVVQRADPVILMEVGSAAIPLFKPPHDMLSTGILMHDTPDGAIVCHQSGIVEPITQAIYDFLERSNDDEREPWVAEVAASGGGPLIARVAAALHQLSAFDEHPIGIWARSQLDTQILPALKGTLAGH